MKLILENFKKFINEEAASIAGQDMPLEALYGDVLDKIILVLNTAYGEDKYNLYKILTDLAEFHARGRMSENDDKVSKKISYLMDKEGKPQKQAVAMALDMEERGKLEEGFKSGEKVTHDEYGDGIVTHPGTKNTNVAVKFDKDTGRGKNIKVNRKALKAAVKEETDAPMEESDDVVEGQYETGAQRAARESAREAKIRELMRTQGLSRSAAEKFAGRSYSQTR
tara:strand:+ start:440 stop:1111 length:672 start_codon:yes stop_codon:yes gene_type:complete